MCRSRKGQLASLCALLALAASQAFADKHEHAAVGRTATPAELRAWDIDVRPDFTGLPPGSGTVANGEAIWIEKCTSCHGEFGDANHVYAPLIGNTTVEDIKTGRVAALRDPGRVRTTIMKVSTVSTLWDFINRAMPWDQPKSLAVNDVYAVVAYLLNLADIVPADFNLSNENIASVQARMPNRNGMTREHGLWDIDGKADTQNKACMRSCKDEVVVSSSLPDFARSAHGNLLAQNREWGAIRGTRTVAKEEVAAPAAAHESGAPRDVLANNGCVGCHAISTKVIGPAFREVAKRHGTRPDPVGYLTQRIRSGSSGAWGDIPMPPQAQVSADDLATIARWLAQGAPD